MAQREVKQWITINGVHVPIFEGESKEDAVNRAIAKKNEDKKQSDIAKHSAQVKEANERQQAAKQPTKEQVKAFSKNPNKVVNDADKKLGKAVNMLDKETGMLKSTRDKIDKMGADELDQAIESNAAYIDRVKQKLTKDGKNENLERTLENHQRWQDYLQKRRDSLGKTGSSSAKSDKMIDMIKDSYIATYGKAKWDSLTDQQKHDAIMLIAKDLNNGLSGGKPKSNLLFKIDWDNLPGTATANSEIHKYLKKNKIDWFTTKYFETAADVDGTGTYYRITTMGGNAYVDRTKVYRKGKD